MFTQKGKILVFLLLTLRITVQGQSPAFMWGKAYGGSVSDQSNSACLTDDKKYLLAGHTFSSDDQISGNHGADDIWVIKTDTSGNLLWQQTLGGSGSDEAYVIKQIGGGHSLIAGRTSSANGDVTLNKGLSDYWLIELDENGNLVTQKTFGGTQDDVATCLISTSDGGYLLAGNSLSYDGDMIAPGNGDYEIRLIKLSSNYTIQWDASYGWFFLDGVYDVAQTVEGGYVLTGVSMKDFAQTELIAIKITSTGGLTWYKEYGGTDNEIGKQIIQTSTFNYVVAGSSYSDDGFVSGNHGQRDVWLMKLNVLGDTVWTRIIGGSGEDDVTSMKATSDGGFLLTVNSQSADGDFPENAGGFDSWLIKINDSGQILWKIHTGGSGDEICRDALTHTDSTYVLTGYSNSPEPSITSVLHGNYDFWTSRFGKPDTTKETGEQDIFVYDVITPNGDGKNELFHIANIQKYPGHEVSVANQWGDNIFSSNDYKNDWDAASVPDGNYYYRVKYKDKNGSEKSYYGRLLISR